MSDAFDRARLAVAKATDAFEDGSQQAKEDFEAQIKIAQAEALIDIAESLREITRKVSPRASGAY